MLENPGSEGKAKSSGVKLHQWKSSVNVPPICPPCNLHSSCRYDLSIHHVWEQPWILQPAVELFSALQNLRLSFIREVKHCSPHALKMGSKWQGFVCWGAQTSSVHRGRVIQVQQTTVCMLWRRLSKLMHSSQHSLQLQYCLLWAFSPFRRHLAELCSVMPRVCVIIKKEKELEISTSLTGQSFTLITAWIN